MTAHSAIPRINLKQPWQLSVLLAAAIPLFPEYVCPFLVIGSLIAAVFDGRSRGEGLRVGPLGKLLLLYMAYMAVGIFYSKNIWNSLVTFLMWVMAFLLYLAINTVLFNRHRFNRALMGITLVAGVVGLIACIQYILNVWFGLKVSFYFWQGIDVWFYQNFPLPLKLEIRQMRSASTFNNPNVMAEYLIMVIPLVMYYSFGRHRTASRILFRFCLLFALGGVLFSFSRGAYLALILILLLLCIFHIKRWRIIFMSVVSVLALLPTSVMSRFSSIGTLDTSTAHRLEMWQISLGEIAKSPLFGSGPGIKNIWDVFLANELTAPHAHSLPLQLLIEGGVIALLLMMMIGGTVFLRSCRMLKRSSPPERRTLGVIFLATVGAFILYGMVDFPFLCPKLVSIFMLLMGLSDSLHHIYEENPGEKRSGFLAEVFLFRKREKTAEKTPEP